MPMMMNELYVMYQICQTSNCSSKKNIWYDCDEMELKGIGASFDAES